MVFNILDKTYTDFILCESNRPTELAISVQGQFNRFDWLDQLGGQTIFATSVLGSLGPHILSIITLYLLLKKSKNIAIYYILCLTINVFLNFLIKYIIKAKRPNTCENCFNRIKYNISFFDTFQYDIFYSADLS